MNAVCIVAAETVTALGDSLEETWRRLSAGESGIRPVTRFPTAGYISTFAACVDGLEGEGGASRVHPLLERLLHNLGPVPADAVPFTASTKWGIDSLERRRRGESAPDADLLAGEFPRLVARRLGLTASGGLNVSAACASSTIALARGAATIANRRAEAVLVCCLDLVSEFVFSGFSALKGLSAAPCRPFDRNRDGLTLGEGAAALLLMSAARARREGRTVLGVLRGWGVAGDAHHITAPARDGSGLIQATRAALRMAGITAEEVAAISAHGTGTVYNDAMELTVFHQLFATRRIPLHSVKGALGHTLGAAGGIETALALKSLATGLVPPTAGCDQPEGEALVGQKAVSFAGDCMLTTNSGFGGINAALVLQKGGAHAG